MTAGAQAAPSTPAARTRVLAVDDEPNVLAALRRSLRARGCSVATAEGGAQALDLMQGEGFDAIISDMRMPGMNGAEFLKAARALQPDAVRLLLTGHADVASALLAVNQGEIFRYLTKPWDDAQLMAALDEGLDRQRLRAERDRLLAQVEAQNAELQSMNQTLEARVAERTLALQQALERSDEAHGQLKKGLTATLQMLGSLVEARAGLTRGIGRRVVEHVRRVGPALGLAGTPLQDAVFAALLVDLGKLLLPERLLLQPLSTLTAEERQHWLAHPQHAHALLLGNPALQGVAELLRALHERHDGQGVPDRLTADAIPLGSRLLAVAVDYECRRCGAAAPTRMDDAQALEALRRGAGQRHDPQVVAAFTASLRAPQGTTPPRTSGRLPVSRLQPGMELAEDLCLREGFALLTRGHTLDEALIVQLKRFQERSERTLSLVVHLPETPPAATTSP